MNPFLKNFLFLGRNRKADSSEHTVVLLESHKGCVRKLQGLCPKVIRVVGRPLKTFAVKQLVLLPNARPNQPTHTVASAYTTGRIERCVQSHRRVSLVRLPCTADRQAPLSPHHRARTADVTTAIANPSPIRHPAVTHPSPIRHHSTPCKSAIYTQGDGVGVRNMSAIRSILKMIDVPLQVVINPIHKRSSVVSEL